MRQHRELQDYRLNERAAPSDRLKSFGPVTNQGTVANYLSQAWVALEFPPVSLGLSCGSTHLLCCWAKLAANTPADPRSSRAATWLFRNLLNEGILGAEGESYRYMLDL